MLSDPAAASPHTHTALNVEQRGTVEPLVIRADVRIAGRACAVVGMHNATCGGERHRGG